MKNVLFLVILLFLLLFVLFGCSNYDTSMYENLKTDYDNLKHEYNDLLENYSTMASKYDDLNDLFEEVNPKLYGILEDVGSLEDDVATVYCFFDHDEDITEEEASSSFDRINSFFDSILYPDH